MYAINNLLQLNLVYGFRQSSHVITSKEPPRFTRACLLHQNPREGSGRECVEYVKGLLGSMDDGRITVSPYDTAWVSLIADEDDGPRFPASLEWISRNQLPDGSWGDGAFFLAYDRLLNTLACVVALKFWNLHPRQVRKGASFIRDNMRKLEEAEPEHMTCGFELVFPSLLQRAQRLGIDGIPYDHPAVRSIFSVRDHKMKRVPMQLLHEAPTCLLHNLEGLGSVDSIGELDWTRLLRLQTPKGSFLTSPAATSFAVMATRDEDCMEYISGIVDKFHGGAPTVYPVDIYARLWAVDRLNRLGISRFFRPEINQCLDHVYRFWRENGVFSARESDFCDIDDTSMGFRLLRLHGYKVSPDPLMNFKNGEEFNCYVGQGFESPSPIFNLYRASQVMFPGETVLEQAREFSYGFLKRRLETNQLLDKWLISKHLPNEIKDGLEMPWYATLPRVEARFYIDTYGVDDIWIGKSLYRMPEINDETYLKLAKLDFDTCQSQHLAEWDGIQRWYEANRLGEAGVSRNEMLLDFFSAGSVIFEVERSAERLCWAKLQTLSTALRSHSRHCCKLGGILLETLRELIKESNAATKLCFDSWEEWISKLREGTDEGEEELELIPRTVSLAGGRIVSEQTLLLDEYSSLSRTARGICSSLRRRRNEGTAAAAADGEMRSLVQLVFTSDDGISRGVKEVFFGFAKAHYYKAFFSADQIDGHVSKVLFEKLVL